MGPCHGTALRNAFLFHIVQQKHQVQRPRIVRFFHGCAHHLQQGAQAVGPLHRAVQHGSLAVREQPGEIPLGHALQLVQDVQRKPAPHQFRHRIARLQKGAAAFSQQQCTARVHQHGLFAPAQRTAAVRHQQQIADILLRRQIEPSARQAQGRCLHFCIQFLPFRFHKALSFPSFPLGEGLFHIVFIIPRLHSAGKTKPFHQEVLS